jgi:hypothetical protein
MLEQTVCGAFPHRHNVPSRINRSIADSLIRDGVDFSEIGRMQNVTGEAIRQYAHASGQYALWKKNRTARKEHTRTEIQRKKQLNKEILILIKKHALSLAYKQSWVEGKTEEYTQTIRGNGATSPSKVKLLLQAYNDARDRQEPIGYWDLGRPLGMPGTSVGKILEQLHIPSLYWNAYRWPKLSSSTVDLWKEACEVGVDCSDVAYFYSTKDRPIRKALICSYFEKINYVPKQRAPMNTSNRYLHQLTYRHASQVYEATDLGFAMREISFLLDMPRDTVAYVVEHRGEIAPIITAALRTLNPTREQDVPYKVGNE